MTANTPRFVSGAQPHGLARPGDVRLEVATLSRPAKGRGTLGPFYPPQAFGPRRDPDHAVADAFPIPAGAHVFAGDASAIEPLRASR
jgi:hypothetical protein